MSRQISICCEHNLCPDRPRWRLGRFVNHPWRCTQCGRWWRTRHEHDYSDWDVGGHWVWIEIQGPVDGVQR